MSKETMQIEIPEAIRGTDLEQKVRDKAARLALEQAVLELYKAREISTETGAKMLGMSLWDFIPWLGEHQVSIFNQTAEELEQEVQTAIAASKGATKPKRRPKKR